MSVRSFHARKVAEDDRVAAYACWSEFGARAEGVGLLLLDKVSGQTTRLVGEGDGHAVLFAALSAKLRRTIRNSDAAPETVHVLS